MAEQFNLTAQLQLQAPKNTTQVVNQIKRDLAPASNLQIKADTRALNKASGDMQKLSRATKQASGNMRELDKVIGESARRFAVITVVTGTFLGLSNAIKRSTKDALEFEREMNKIQQVTGKTSGQLQSLSKEVDRLSKGLGTSAQELLGVSRTLLQTGLEAEKVQKIIGTLAKTDLGATFGNLQDTTEGAIALLRQFGLEAKRAGGEAAFLEKSLDAINSVSKKFAVESSDIITAIRKTGGVFAAAGGEVNELIALFTSVRATTRESADTIATGLRTIFTRIQRTETVDQLKELGIQLRDSQGNFVGAFKAFELLAKGLRGLDPRDYRFSEIVESLGGFRQVGKVIPLIQQFKTAQEALNVATNANGSVSKDAETAQKTLANQIDKTKQSFDSLVRTFADSATFKGIVGGALDLANAFIKVTETLKPLLPLITTLLSIKVGRGLFGVAKGFAGVGGGGSFGRVPRFANGGKVLGFNSGGVVPGTGNRDTVPAMLTPGEFVIKKSSVAKMGTAQLQAMNENRLNKGSKKPASDKGKTVSISGKSGSVGLFYLDTAYSDRRQNRALTNTIKGSQIPTITSAATAQRLGVGPEDQVKLNLDVATAGLSSEPRKLLGTEIKKGFGNTIATVSDNLTNTFNIPPLLRADEQAAAKAARSTITDEQLRNIEGAMFEAVVSSTTGAALGDAGSILDIPNVDGGLLKRLSLMFATGSNQIVGAELKRSLSSDTFGKAKSGTMVAKMLNVAATDPARYGMNVKKLNSGGSAGKGSPQDTVPALLTPGEFVINKEAANRIGTTNLNMMNKQGVARFNKGGQVGPRSGSSLGLGAQIGGNNAQDIEILADAMRQVGVEAKTFESILGMLIKELESGSSNAEAYTKGMQQVIKQSKEAQAQAQKEAKAKQRNRGDQAAGDSTLSSVKNIGKGPVKSFDQGGMSRGGLINAIKNEEAVRKQAIAQQKKEIIAIAKEIRSIDQSVSMQDAVTRAQNQVRNVYGVLAKEVQVAAPEAGRLSQAMKRAREGLSAVKQATQAFIGRAQAGAQALQPVAQSAQSFAFLATGLISVIGQLGIFDEKTSEAATQAAAFGAIMLGTAGTIIDVTASTANTAAVTANTSAKITETSATVGAATAIGAFALPVTIAVVAITAMASVIFFFNKRAKQAAEELSQQNNKTLEKIATTGNASPAFVKSVKDRTDEELRALERDPRSQGATAARTGVSSSGAISEEYKAEIQYRKDLRDATINQIEAFAKSAKQLASFREELAGIEKAGFSPEVEQQKKQELAKRQVDAGVQADISVSDKKQSETIDKAATRSGLTRSQLLTQTDDQLTALVSSGDLQENEKLLVQSARLQREKNAAQFADTQQLVANTRLAAEDAKSRREMTELLIRSEQQQLANIKARGQADGTLTDEDIKELEKAQKDRAASYKAADDQFEQSQARIKAANEAYAEAVLASAEAARQSAAYWNGINERLADQQNTLNSLNEQQQIAGDSYSRSNLTFDAQGGDNALSGNFGRNRPASFDEFNKRRRGTEAIKATTVQQIQDRQDALKDLKDKNIGLESDEGEKKVLKAVGFNEAAITAQFGEEAAKKMKEAIFKQFNESTTGEVDFAAIYAPLEEATAQSAQKVEAEVKEMNGNLDIAAAKFSLAAQKIATLNAGFDVLFDTQSRVADINAKARGTSSAKEQIRISDARAQNRLNLNAGQRGGVGLQAGNLQNLQAAKRQAFQDQTNAAANRRNGITTADQFDQTMRQTTQTIKDVDAELERMAKGTARVAELEERLAKAQAAREQGKSVVEDFVTGGQDARRALQLGASGIQSAIATGTTQNLSEEQRAQTFSLLDRLSGVENLFGSGMKGEDLKDKLIQQDAVRLGFDPKVIEALYNGTSVEQNILLELEQQTDQMLTAADLRAWRPAGIAPNNQQQQNQQQGPPVAPNPNDVNIGPMSGNNASQTDASQRQNAPDANPYQLDPSAVGSTPTQQQQAQQQKDFFFSQVAQAQQQQDQTQARKPGRNTIAGVEAEMAKIQERYEYATPGSGYDREDTARMAKLKRKKENLEKAQAARAKKEDRKKERADGRRARAQIANSPLGQMIGLPSSGKELEQERRRKENQERDKNRLSPKAAYEKRQSDAEQKAKDDAFKAQLEAEARAVAAMSPEQRKAYENRQKDRRRADASAIQRQKNQDAALTTLNNGQRTTMAAKRNEFANERAKNDALARSGAQDPLKRVDPVTGVSLQNRVDEDRFKTKMFLEDPNRAQRKLDIEDSILGTQDYFQDLKTRDENQKAQVRYNAENSADPFSKTAFAGPGGTPLQQNRSDNAISNLFGSRFDELTAKEKENQAKLEQKRYERQNPSPLKKLEILSGAGDGTSRGNSGGVFNVTDSPLGFNKADSAYGANPGIQGTNKQAQVRAIVDSFANGGTINRQTGELTNPRAGTSETINGENTTQSEQNPFAKFSEGLNNIVTQFSSVTSALTQLSSTFQDGIQINHNFSGDMTLALNIQNSDALKAALGEAITPKIKELIEQLMGNELPGPDATGQKQRG